MLRCTVLIVSIALSFAAGAASEIRLWHSMSGARGAELERIVARFNASQREYRVVATYKGAYDEATVEAVTARHAPRAPHLVQASALGGAFLLEQKDAIRPLWQLLALGPALGGADDLTDAEGRLLALPLGRSTPVLYFNRDLFRVAALDPAKPPATWTDMVDTIAALIAAGADCGLALGAAPSMVLENLAAWHNQAFATDRLVFNNRLAVRWVSTLATWSQSGYFTPHGGDDAEARFARGECALLAGSPATYPELRRRAGFDLGVAPFPYYDDFDGAPLHTLASGPALWVMAQRAKGDYPGVARFLAFLARPEVQAEWHQRTGLLPLSVAAYELTRQQGFYAKVPGQEVGVRQLLQAGTPNWRSLRLAQVPELGAIIDEELGLVWQGKKTTVDALNAAVTRGNALLDRLAGRE